MFNQKSPFIRKQKIFVIFTIILTHKEHHVNKQTPKAKENMIENEKSCGIIKVSLLIISGDNYEKITVHSDTGCINLFSRVRKERSNTFHSNICYGYGD